MPNIAKLRRPTSPCGHTRMPGQWLGEHGIVLGASVSGLLAARVLADSYRRVTVIERDDLPEVGAGRRGVPQGRHAHGLLPRGAQIMDELFPGLLEDFVASGVSVVREPSEMHFCLGGRLLCQDGRYAEPTVTYQPSRPLLEGHILARVRALPNVEIVDRCAVSALTSASSPGQVNGVRVRRHGADGEEVIDADLVVDATGRTGRALNWLADLGYQQPSEDRLQVDIMYVSQHLRLEPGAMGRTKVVIIGPEPGRPTGAELLEQEDGQWLLTLIGYGEHHPPTEQEAYLAFAETIVPRHVFTAIRDAVPLNEPTAHRFPASVRRRYEKLANFPEGFVVVGDAICSFNPVYAQGMSVSALQALALQQVLADGQERLGPRFFKASSRSIDVAWRLAVSSDMVLPEVEGELPPPLRLINSYFDRVLTAAQHDPVLTEKFVKVQSMIKPPTILLTPAVIARIVASGMRRRRTSPGARRLATASVS
jgi:2-polyprenyl-6-methoxyphenol hydroxylase-like FAD-dependent oxidoreductase